MSGAIEYGAFQGIGDPPSPFTAYSFNVGEALLMTAFPVLWPLLVPTPWATSLLFLIHQIFRNTLLHAGYELMPARADGRPWFDWITTTTHHDLHHATQLKISRRGSPGGIGG